MKKNILITGAAKRIGANCAQHLHSQGHNILLHYHASQREAEQLCDKLNNIRADSALLCQANLRNMGEISQLGQAACTNWGGIDVLINNASAFYPTPFADISEAQWDELLDSNLKAPFFLAKALTETLTKRRGCIVNIVDIHAERGMPGYSAYSISKAGLVAMTKVLAKELSPAVRVNAVAPGAIIWPETDLSEQGKNEILQKVPLASTGTPGDIAKAVAYLINDADYVTGQILTVDGGRTLFY